MAYSSYVIQSSTLKSIASAVRSVTGKTESFTPAQMISEVENIKFYLVPYELASNSSLQVYSSPTVHAVGYRAFRGCTNLREINLENCEYIDLAALEHCPNLTTVRIPRCKVLGNYAFTQNSALTSIYLDKVSSVTTVFSAITLTQVISAKFYVPASLYTAFCDAMHWSVISDQIVSV